LAVLRERRRVALLAFKPAYACGREQLQPATHSSPEDRLRAVLPAALLLLGPLALLATAGTRTAPRQLRSAAQP
jgi:hypothetical protein